MKSRSERSTPWEMFATDAERILAGALQRMDANGLTRARVGLRIEAAEARKTIRERAA